MLSIPHSLVHLLGYLEVSHCLCGRSREIILTYFCRVHLSLTNEGIQPEKFSILVVFLVVSVSLKINQESLAQLIGTLNLLRGEMGNCSLVMYCWVKQGLSSAWFGKYQIYPPTTE